MKIVAFVLEEKMRTKGFITSKEIKKRNLSFRQINALCQNGSLIKIKSGLYRNAEMFLNNQSFIDVCTAIPSGIISRFSALAYYNLTTFVPQYVYVDVAKIGHKRKILYPPTKQYQVDENKLKNNVIKVKEGKYSFRIYEIEKVVCDAVKFRNQIGFDITKEVIKEYLKRKDNNLPKLYKIAKKNKVFKKLNEILSVMS